MRTFHNARPGRREEVHSADDVRQGDIALRRRWQRGVFIIGLSLFVILLLLGVVISYG